MPLARRMPKFGFVSRKGRYNAEVRLDDLARVAGESVDLQALRRARLVDKRVRRVKVIAAGKLDKPVVVKGLGVTRGARAAIEAAGGRVEES
jgi:large subunit ribosomal protein L15